MIGIRRGRTARNIERIRSRSGQPTKLDRATPSAYHPRKTGRVRYAIQECLSIPVICEASAPMRDLPLEPGARLRRALFPPQDSQRGWRLASVIASLVSVGLIA